MGVIDLPLLPAYVAAAALLAATPGVDTAIVLRSSLLGGRRAAAGAALGVALGCLIWGVAVSLGLGVLLHTSERAYAVAKYLGAAYLLVLGVQMLRQPRAEFATLQEPWPSGDGLTTFRQGLLANALNPKVGVFYVTFLPQFVPLGSNVAGYTFFLACIHVVLALAWFALLIMATAPLHGWLSRPSVMQSMDRLAGSVLIAFGLKLAVSSPR